MFASGVGVLPISMHGDEGVLRSVATGKASVESFTASKLVQRVPAAAAIAVEYPGFVRNLDHALATLGDAEAITTATRSNSNILKLHFRPSEPTCHPLYGDRRPTCRFLLRIARRKAPPIPTSAAAADAQPTPMEVDTAAEGSPDLPATAVTARVVARIVTTFGFSGIADYQYVPLDTRDPVTACTNSTARGAARGNRYEVGDVEVSYVGSQ